MDSRGNISKRFLALGLGVALALLFTPFCGAKSIQLRSGTIVTPSKPTNPVQGGAGGGQPAKLESGLFLIQFETVFQPAWTEGLSAAGVKLVSYVPQDAFVARLNRASLEEIRSLEFVRWIGPYTPQHKLERRLVDRMAKPVLAAAAQPASVSVNLVLAPDADPADLHQARGCFGKLDQESRNRFCVILRGAVPVPELNALARSPAVLWMEPRGQIELFDEISSQIVAGDAGPGQTVMQSLGYDGSGVTVAVADSGLNNGNAGTMHLDLFGRVDAFFHYGSLTDASDEHAHGTHVTGIIAGNAAVGETDDNGELYGLGVAPGAHIVAQRIFDGDGNYEAPSSFGALTRDAVQAGADIGSNSWGDDTQGRYNADCAEFDALVRDADSTTPGDQPYILEFSSGNAGPGAQSVGSPAVAKNVIATGASQNNRFDQLIYADGQEAMADFSSRGPAEDGRIKPDLVAPGTWIASAQSASASAVNAWLPISPNYQYQGGTSQAGPQVSGAAAIFVQFYRANNAGVTPSPAMVKAALINSAVDMDDEYGTVSIPNNDEGWGRADLTRLIGSDREHQFVDQSELLRVGEVYERQVVVDDINVPLKITLAYTDVPGFPGAIPVLVNNLDLEVTGPDGKLYRGNQFDGGESVAGGSSGDGVNNVEGVHFENPRAGVYRVRVRARNVAGDARIDTAGMDQDFALVVSGSFLPPAASLIFFDRAFYTAPDSVLVSVLDFAIAGQGSLTVSLHSETEEAGELLTLIETSVGGLFTNSISTAVGVLGSDGLLQVSHDDLVQGYYVQLPDVILRESVARIDLVPPVLSDVDVTDEFGRTRVLWNTDERADGAVHFGTSAVLDRSQVRPGFRQAHDIELVGLTAGETYFYIVVSTDRAGNTATNDNGGALFSFVAPFAPDVLMVDAFFGDFLLEPPPAIANYTDTLEANDVSYELWDVLSQGSPTLSDLKPFRVVIWRLPVFSLSRPTLTPAEQGAIRQYVEEGGSFMLADMDVLTRLEETGAQSFMREVLHVERFETDTTLEFLEGIDGDPITDGMVINLSYYEEYFGFDISDNITPTGDAVPIFLDAYTGGYGGVRFPRPGINSLGRVVFLPFPFDTIPTDSSPSRAEFMLSVLKFLAPGLKGEAVVTLDRNAYTIPSQMTVEVADSDLIGEGQVMVSVTSTTDTVGLMLALDETSRIGVFRGVVTLVAHTNVALTGQLRVKEDDIVEVRFFDESLLQTVSASARVETVPPVISGISHVADYIDATVSWTTSEPSDALVQYSESRAFLDNRTAFNASLSTAHRVQITGLLPAKTYYYRVVSRDEAGNGSRDDNAGALYSFRTRTPLVPPWSDDLESGDTAWVVMDDEFTESSWTLGVPRNGVVSQAHSPNNAWASNIDGGRIETSGTLLVSPAIDLTTASTATLRFWHSLQFSDLPLDIVETAAVLIKTNNLSSPQPIRILDNNTAGWEQMTVDLTPYAGRVIFVVWNYALFSFEFGARPGWVVDDISVEMTQVSGGVVVITNNLSQGQWSLTGPLNQTGGGVETVLPDVAPGSYTATFGEVPFYATPAPQTGNVSAGGRLVLSGIYTFEDVNGNGISDAWEQVHFGEVSPSHPGTTDSDGDGLDDFGEFTAGTDPNDAGSVLILTDLTVMPSGDVRLDWVSTAGRSYRVQGSGDGVTWVPVSDWMRAAGSAASATIPAPTAGSLFMFRVEVRP